MTGFVQARSLVHLRGSSRGGQQSQLPEESALVQNRQHLAVVVVHRHVALRWLAVS